MHPSEFGGAALNKLLTDYNFQSILDVGSGVGWHAAQLRLAGKDVTTLSLPPHQADIQMDFMDYQTDVPFDAVWCSHTLEHQLNVHDFLVKLRHTVKDGGVCAITVPPAKPQLVGGHLTLWTAGSLIYNMVMAGWNCRHAAVATYGYNISVIVRRDDAELPWENLRMDAGDLEQLSEFFPWPVVQNDSGIIPRLHW